MTETSSPESVIDAIVVGRYERAFTGTIPAHLALADPAQEIAVFDQRRDPKFRF